MARLSASSSLVAGAPLREPSAVRVAEVLRFFGGARGLALSLSLFAHVSVALFAAHRSHGAPRELAQVSAASLIEVADAEVLQEQTTRTEPTAIRASSLIAPSAASPRTVARTAVADAPVAVETAPVPASDVVATAAPDTAPRFTMTVAATSSALVATPSNSGAAVAAASVEAPISERAADVPAKLLVGAPPGYTPAAQAAGVEADVPLEIIVDRTGAVQSARSLSHIGYGLDEAALAAVRSYRFSAAHRAGSAVAVRMHWLMRFQLR